MDAKTSPKQLRIAQTRRTTRSQPNDEATEDRTHLDGAGGQEKARARQ